MSRVRSVRVWGPSTGPTARALAGQRCAPRGWRKGVHGGGAIRRCEGPLGSGAPPPPAARPLGGLPETTTHWLWVRGGAGVGTHHRPHSARSCELALRAVEAARGRPGGAPLAWVWGVRGRALSHPRLPALWASCRGPLPTGCGCGGVRAWGSVTNPTARALTCSGGGMRVPGGGASGLGVGRPGSGALPPPTARPLGGLPGPTTHWLWVRVAAGVGTRHQPHSAPLASWLCALWGRHEVAQGGRLLPGCGASGVGRSPGPDCPPSGWAAGAHYPLAVGAGGCGRGDPSATPQRALLRASCARSGGGTRAPGGGASCLGVGRPGSGALLARTARPLGGLPGPTTHWLWVRGGAGVGTRHQPHSAGRMPGGGASCAWGQALSHPLDPPTARPLGGLPLLRAGCARSGGGTRVPGGGASCLGVGRPGSGALLAPNARPLGGLPGPTTHWLWAWGGAGVGTRHQPHSARSCELALRAVGAARGCPGGAPLAWVWGVRGRALSHPRLPALWAGCRGPLPTGCWCGGVRAWGPVTNPTARWLCALPGRHEGARGGRLLPGCGASGVGRSPGPECPPSGWAAGAHYPLAVGAGGCGRGDPSSTPQRALLRAGFSRCGGGTRMPGGGASCLGVGRLGSGDLPPPTARSLGGLPGPTTHWLWAWGGAGVGTRHQPHSTLALRAVGAA